MVWRWDNADPFGATQPNQNPSGLGAFTYNPRFPGQVYDAETGLYYNYHRSYNPSIGAYTQSDPIGLAGGINTYGYVGGNPVNWVDRKGLYAQVIMGYCRFFPAQCAVAASAAVAAAQSCVDGIDKMFNEANNDNKFPDRKLPRDDNGRPVPDPEAEGANTQLGQKEGRKGKYDQGREFDANGQPVRDIDFTDHGRPQNHQNPHQHDYVQNPTGGTPQHGPSKPLVIP